MELMQAHHQWLNRPADERFLSLTDLSNHTCAQMNNSKSVVVSSRSVNLKPADDNKGLVAVGPTGNEFVPTHWAFNQLCQRVSAPAEYMRSLPSPLVADCLNYGYQYNRDIQDVGLLLYQNGGPAALRAVNGPNYGRIWQAEVARALIEKFGDGVTGKWHVPGEFNKSAPITKDNTTIYCGDRDMWVFLADGDNDIEIKNRRGSRPGRLQRGFFMWNSEVGARPIGLAGFLFDYMCCNHIIWGAEGFNEIRIRHTASAPDRWLEEILPALTSYANGSSHSVVDAIAAAQNQRIGDPDKVAEFLAKRFGPRMVGKLQAVHGLEEGKPIETVFDAVTAATALARSIPYIGERVELEREAGKLLELVAA